MSISISLSEPSSSLGYKKQCTICREPIFTSSLYLPVNITLQKLIEKKYPEKTKEKERKLEEEKKENEEIQSKLFNIPVMLGGTHLFPGMKTIMTVNDRQGLDLLHLVLRGNRRFVLMRSYSEMRGFVLFVKQVFPSTQRNVQMVEVEGVDRFIGDKIYIPEDRRGLY